MSWSRRNFLAVIPLALAACGFQPVYGPGGSGSALYGQVAVSAPETVESYYLVENLEQRLGRAGSAAYALDVAVVTATQGQAITAANETTRYSLVGEAGWGRLPEAVRAWARCPHRNIRSIPDRLPGRRHRRPSGRPLADRLHRRDASGAPHRPIRAR